MEEKKASYIKDIKKAQMFIDDSLNFDLSSVNIDFIKKNVNLAEEHLKAVQNATLELEDINSEEFELKYKEKTSNIRKKLSDFITSSNVFMNMTNYHDSVKVKNTISNASHKISKGKENKQEPRIFGKPLIGKKYKIGSILPCENSGCDLDVPIREFKLLSFDSLTSLEGKENAFVKRLGKFAGACMNARFNGTIYFGVADEKGEGDYKHGEIIGINIQLSEAFHFEEWIEKHFKGKNALCLKTCSPQEKIAFTHCISRLHVIELEGSERIVLEVDIEPYFNSTKYLNFKVNFPNNKKKGVYYVRNASSSYQITGEKEVKEFLKVQFPQYVQKRKDLENDKKEIPTDNNLRLLQLIFKGETRISFEKFHYFLIVNCICQEPCCRMDGIQDLDWITNIEWKVIFDFNPNAKENGVLKLLKDCKNVIDKPSEITTEQIGNLFETDLKDNVLLKNYGRKTLHITCCNKEDKKQYFTDWKGHIMPHLRKLFDALTGLNRIPTTDEISIIVLCCSKEREKEFLKFLREISSKFEILKQFSFLAQNSLHLKAATNSIIEEYDTDVESRNIHKLIKENSLCLQWNVIDSFVKQITSNIAVEDKLIQSSSGVYIPLKPKLIQKFVAVGLYILASNECEELQKLQSLELKNIYNDAMKDFLRGIDPSWKLFYFVYKKMNIGKVIPEALIEREKVKEIMTKIMLLKSSEENCIELISIGHLPGSGASTIAMNVLWLLKEKFRCVKIESINPDNATLENLALLLLQLRSFGEHDEQLVQGEYKEKIECLPLLILMDDTNYELAKDFQTKIQNEVFNKKIKFRKTLGIIIFVHGNIVEEYPKCKCFKLSSKFSDKESEIFLNKLQEFESDIGSEHSDQSNITSDQLQLEDMIGFLVMMSFYLEAASSEKQNIFKARISKIVSKVECALDGYPNEKLLLLVLAIFKFYGDGNLSLSHSANLLGYGYQNLLVNICDHTKMLVRTKRINDEFGNYEVVEVTHFHIAEILIEKFLKSEVESIIEILFEIFENKSIMNHPFLRYKLLKDIQALVVRRKWINDVKRAKFSPLILQLKNKNPLLAIKLLKKIIITLESLNIKSIDSGLSIIHQTLSRLYLDIDELDLAKESIYIPIGINSNNFRYYDTLGQIFKKEVYNCCKSNENKMIIMNDFLQSASSAIKNFKKAQLLFENQNVKSTTGMYLNEDFNDDALFNPSIFQGYFGEIEVNLFVAEKLLDLSKNEEVDDLRSFISGKKGNLKVIAEKNGIDLSKYGSLIVDIYDRAIKCMNAVMQKVDSKINRNQKTYKQLGELCKRFNKVFSTDYFSKLPDVLGNTKTTLKDKISQIKVYFEINLALYLYHVQNSKPNQKYLLYETVKAFNKFSEKEKFELKSLDTNIILCFLNANLSLNPKYPPIFEFENACYLSKYVTHVDLDMYEYYFWYTVLNWPTDRERIKNFAKTYDEALLERCVKKLQTIYYSSVQFSSVRKVRHFYTHAPLYWLNDEIEYKKITKVTPNNQRLTGKLIDNNSVEYCLPHGTKLKIRCAHLKINRGTLAENVTFELGFTLAGPVAYNSQEDMSYLKSYNDGTSSNTA